MILKCPGCGQRIDAPTLPNPHIENLPSCTVVIFEHPKPMACACGAEFLPFITAVRSCDVTARKVVRRDAPRIVVPGRAL